MYYKDLTDQRVRELVAEGLTAEADPIVAVLADAVASTTGATQPGRPGPTCEWFCTCPEDADGMVLHPILGYVVTCRRCADLLGLDLVDLVPELVAKNADGTDSLAVVQARKNLELILDGADFDQVHAASRKALREALITTGRIPR